ncbi:hypothetical protein NPIL_91331 [Nephila pilipes]|uniref:Uncharacterized protein n=1 Tax=Nephila pilipes TaxID=299642 RepID=A0A8X6NVP8_NEPPI|nr:hypothetical protein NPIL_91331 [Nephila pilipes]
MAKVPADRLPQMPSHAILNLMPKWPTYVISEPILVLYPLLGDVYFPRLGKNLVSKSFSTTIGWLYLVVAKMNARSPKASCPML